jgi:hypothetical protein
MFRALASKRSKKLPPRGRNENLNISYSPYITEKCIKPERISEQVVKNPISPNHPDYDIIQKKGSCQPSPPPKKRLPDISVRSLIDYLTSDNSHLDLDIFYLLRGHPGGIITQ